MKILAALFLLIPLCGPAQQISGGGGGSVVRSIGVIFGTSDGPTLVSGTTVYLPRVPFSCNVTRWDVSVNSGSVTLDVWKASGSSIPTVANTIVASAPPSITSPNTTNGSTTLTGWTTSIATGDKLAFYITSASGANTVSVGLSCS